LLVEETIATSMSSSELKSPVHMSEGVLNVLKVLEKLFRVAWSVVEAMAETLVPSVPGTTSTTLMLEGRTIARARIITAMEMTSFRLIRIPRWPDRKRLVHI
jgi:hypothetical protein